MQDKLHAGQYLRVPMSQQAISRTTHACALVASVFERETNGRYQGMSMYQRCAATGVNPKGGRGFADSFDRLGIHHCHGGSK
jgi:hypothetical protein